MAITGRFEGDFSKFVDACNKAELKLRDFEGGAGKVSSALDKMGNSFSGVKLIQDANLLTKAIGELEGATKLTGKEQERVNAVLNEAIEKYKVLGKQAPQAMLDLAAATKKVEQPTKDVTGGLNSIMSGLTSIGGLIGISFGASAVVAFASKVLDTASAINDTSLKLGISTDAVQGFKFAAEQAGSSLDTVGISINKMNANLAQGDKSTVEALKAAGLSFHAIRDMKPEDAFLAITDAIQTIPDPMERADIAVKLFGKGGAELLPAIKEGFRGVSDAANKMSSDTIKALDDAGDAWGRLKDTVVIATGTIIAQMLDAGKEITSGWRGVGLFLDNAIKMGPAAAVAMAGANNQVIASLNTLTEKQKQTITQYLQVGVSVEDVKKQLHLTTEQMTLYVSSAVQAASATEDLGKKTHLTKDEQAALDAANKKAAEAVRQHAEAIQKLADAYSGTEAIRKAKDTLEAVNVALKQGTMIAQLSVEQQKAINKTVDEGIEVFRRHGQIAPQAMRDLWMATMQIPPVISGLTKDFEKLGETIKVTVPTVTKDWAGAIPVIEGLGAAWGNVGEKIKPVVPAVTKVKDHTDELARSLAQLATISGGAFGSIIRGLSTMVSALDVAKKSVGEIEDGFKAGGFSGITQMASGIAGIASAAIAAGTALKGMWDHFFGTAGRDAVKDFAASFGGFDMLHVKLGTLGDAGEQLWIKLTQGVGRNNPAEAKKAIDAINAALAGQDAWMQRLPGLIEKYGLSWEEAGNKAKQAHLDEIAAGLIQDFADLSKAGFDITLITEKMSVAMTDYYRLAMKTGVEIPIAMRPLLQKMIDLGDLTDEAGNKIENLDDVHWAMTLTDGFKGVIDAIHELTEALTKGVKPALEEIGRTVVHPTIKPRYDSSDIPTGNEVPGFARGGVVLPFARGGFVPRGTDTVPAMLTPGEVVLTKAQQRNLGGVTIGSITINASGSFADTSSARRELAQMVAEEIMRQQRLVTRLNVA